MRARSAAACGRALAVRKHNPNHRIFPAIAADLSSRKLQGTYTIHDLWTKQARGDTGAAFVAQVPPHDVILLRLKEKK